MQVARKEALYLLCCLLLFGFLLRVYPLEEYHSWDESIYLQHAEHLFSGKSNYDETAFRPPLLPLIMSGAFLLWHSAFAASVLVALIATSVILAAFLIAQRLHSTEAGLFAAAVAAVHPAFVYFGHLLLTDALVASLAAFALYFALCERRECAFVAGVFAGLAGLMKFTGFGVVILLFLFLGWKAARKFRLTSLAAFTIGAALVILPYLLWAQQRFGSALLVFQKAQDIVNNQQGSALFYLNPGLFIFPLLLGIVLFAYHKEYRKRQPFIILSVAWMASLLAYLTTFPNKEVRYGLLAVVPLFAIAGIGYASYVNTLKEHRTKAVIGILLIIMLFSLGSFSHLAQPPVNHWKSPSIDMALYIAGTNTSLPIYTPSFYPLYAYYTNSTVVVIDGPRFIQAYPRIMPRDGYLVVYKDAWREPTVGWADSQARLTRIRENDEIILYAYNTSA